MIPDRLIEKVHAGEATEAERARVLADPVARARLEALPALDREFLAAHPADAMLPRIEARARVASAKDDAARRRAAIGGALLIPLVAAVLALFVVGAPPPSDSTTGTELTTAKGPLTAKLRVYRLRDRGPERIPPGIVAREGDRLQLGIIPGNATHAVVVSIDGRGAVTLHFPSEPKGSTALGKGETITAQGYELDDAPDYERFFLVADDEPLSVDDVVAAAEDLARRDDAKTGDLALPRGPAQSSFLVRKEPR